MAKPSLSDMLDSFTLDADDAQIQPTRPARAPAPPAAPAAAPAKPKREVRAKPAPKAKAESPPAEPAKPVRGTTDGRGAQPTTLAGRFPNGAPKALNLYLKTAEYKRLRRLAELLTDDDEVVRMQDLIRLGLDLLAQHYDGEPLTDAKRHILDRTIHEKF